MESVIDQKLDLLRAMRSGAADARKDALLRRALETLYGNIIPAPDGKTLYWGELRSLAPAMPRYVGHWNWDSAFCAMALARFDALCREFRLL